jgi:hypothetical protein
VRDNTEGKLIDKLQAASLRLLDEFLDVVQPPNVLLVVYVVGDEQGHPGIDATLLEVLLKQNLEVLVKVVERGPGVQCPPRPVLLGGCGVGEIGGREVPQVLDQEVAILGGGIDGKSTLARSLDADVGMGGEALLSCILVELVVKLFTVGRGIAVFGCDADVTVASVAQADGALGAGPARLAVDDVVDLAVVHGGVVEVLVGHIVVQVGSGEGDADLLVAEGAGEGNLLVTGLILELQKLVLTFIRVQCVSHIPQRGCSRGIP